MYVLTSGWYSDMVIVGVTLDESEAQTWESSGNERDYYGPFSEGIPSEGIH